MKESYIKELVQMLVKIDDSKLARDFLENILTPAELEEISIRLQIFKQLLSGKSQREVAQTLGVSLATVSRGSREIKYGKNGVKKILTDKR